MCVSDVFYIPPPATDEFEEYTYAESPPCLKVSGCHESTVTRRTYDGEANFSYKSR